VIARWRKHSPDAWLTDAVRGPAIREAFSGRIYVAVGKHDEFGLAGAARHFHALLAKAGIKDTLVETDGGHLDIEGIIGGAFEFALVTLD
jgi:hypothetical protein